MTRLLPLILLLSTLLLLPACTDRALDPAYPAAVITFDDGLIGTWIYQPEEDKGGTMTVTIAPDEVPIAEDRLAPSSKVQDNSKTAKVYTLRLEATDGEEPITIALNAYSLNISGRDYLGGQISLQQLQESKLGPLVAPVHYIIRIERTGDSLRVWGNEPAIAWIPSAAPLDPPPALLAGPPKLPTESADTMAVIATDINRVIELLRRPDADKLFSGESVVFLRQTP